MVSLLAAQLPSTGELVLSSAAIVVLAVAVTSYKFVFASSVYDGLGLPLAGEPEGTKSFSLKSRLRYYYDCAALCTDAYYRFGKKGKAALVPGYGGRADLILPESSTECLGHSRYWGDPWQFQLVKTQLNNMMQSLVPAVDDELHYIVPKVLGTGTTHWKEIDLDHVLRTIVAGSSSRFTVDFPLCRKDDYLRRTLSITDGVMITAIVGNCIPKILLPIAARLASIHTWRNLDKIKQHITPEYHTRMAALSKHSKDQPQDQLQVMLRFAQKKRPQEVNDIGLMATRLAASNFVSMHQTAGTCVQILLNIIDSDKEFGTMDKHRSEADQALASGPWGWEKSKFLKMNGHDSVARESMRVTFPFGNRGLLRKVLKDGVVTDGGIPLKKGTIIAFLASQAQRDPAKFDDPEKFDPWRFSRMLEEEEEKNKKATAAEVEIKTEEAPKQGAYHANAFVTTSPDYLPFGHGRHACPGRFLVDFELKMIVANILKHYDLEFPPEYNGRRPMNRQVAELQAPPKNVKIRVRRRAEKV
ncbi:putative cytochrome P450 [Colletotrichum sublineola]|uniref:Putative cytochrome P450 n=1 Tax=Colletotrichum sublineola TaxID=1173701 RepID=A0A066XRB7_COLSU|nr:putative cytochrome P450 [Colletotrichum sublineola]